MGAAARAASRPCAGVISSFTPFLIGFMKRLWPDGRWRLFPKDLLSSCFFKKFGICLRGRRDKGFLNISPPRMRHHHPLLLDAHMSVPATDRPSAFTFDLKIGGRCRGLRELVMDGLLDGKIKISDCCLLPWRAASASGSTSALVSAICGHRREIKQS